MQVPDSWEKNGWAARHARASKQRENPARIDGLGHAGGGRDRAWGLRITPGQDRDGRDTTGSSKGQGGC